MSKNILTWVQKPFWKAGNQLLLAPDPYPNSQYASRSRSMRILVFLFSRQHCYTKNYLFQDGVGKRGRFIEPHWRNKGKGFKYYLPNLERFFFKVIDKASTEHEAIHPEEGYLETVPRDFLTSGFFMDHLPLGSWVARFRRFSPFLILDIICENRRNSRWTSVIDIGDK